MRRTCRVCVKNYLHRLPRSFPGPSSLNLSFPFFPIKGFGVFFFFFFFFFLFLFFFFREMWLCFPLFLLLRPGCFSVVPPDTFVPCPGIPRQPLLSSRGPCSSHVFAPFSPVTSRSRPPSHRYLKSSPDRALLPRLPKLIPPADCRSRSHTPPLPFDFHLASPSIPNRLCPTIPIGDASCLSAFPHGS